MDPGAAPLPATLRIGVLTLDWPPIGGGMSRFCHETCLALAARGHRLLVLGPRHNAQGGAAPGTHPRMTVVPGLIGDLTTDHALLREHDAAVDVWHAWEFGFSALAVRTRRPFFVTVHGNDLYHPKVFHRFTQTPLLHRLARWTHRPLWQRRLGRGGIRRTTRFLPNSRGTAERLVAFLGFAPPMEVITCGVADRFFQTHGLRKGPPRLLTVCSLSRNRPRKNVKNVLQALAGLKDRFAFEYSVCGAGDMRPDLEAMAASLDLQSRVTFHGHVDEAGLLAFYRDADLFVLAPYEETDDLEGFGIVYLEANAAGTPVLATRTGGVPDAVQEHVSGFFAASPSTEDIAASLEQYFSGLAGFDPDAVRRWAESHRYEGVACRLERCYRSP